MISFFSKKLVDKRPRHASRCRGPTDRKSISSPLASRRYTFLPPSNSFSLSLSRSFSPPSDRQEFWGCAFESTWCANVRVCNRLHRKFFLQSCSRWHEIQIEISQTWIIHSDHNHQWLNNNKPIPAIDLSYIKKVLFKK